MVEVHYATTVCHADKVHDLCLFNYRNMNLSSNAECHIAVQQSTLFVLII